MSFLADGPALFTLGATYARHESESATTKKAVAACGTTVAIFVAVSAPLYLERPWTKPIWKALRAKSGRDWMINSGVLKIDASKVGPRGHVLSTLLFFTYPLWFWLGYLYGRR